MNLTQADIRFLCTALGFTAVAMQGKAQDKDSALRAAAFASLIEEFCRTHVPEMAGATVLAASDANPIMDF
jgi:hypothetical protein